MDSSFRLDTSLNASLNSSMSKRRISLNRNDYRGGSMATHKKFTGPNLDESESSEFIDEQFDIRLNSLNEINSKSFKPNDAFKYNFINTINAFINTQKIDFKIVAASLDAGTRIYISKVGLIYDNTQKISSSLAMATEEPDMNSSDVGNEQSEKRKRKKRKSNIVNNIETLNSKLETTIEIDPLFYHLKSAFDVGNASSLLMSNLVMNPEGTLLLDSNADLNFDSMPNMENNLLNCPLIKEELVMKKTFVCHPFSNFEFLNRDVDMDTENFTEEINFQTATNTEELNFDYNVDTDDQDINNIPDMMDEDFPEACSPNTEGNSIETEQNIEKKTNEADFNVLDLLPNENENNQFFNRNFLRNTFKNAFRYRNLKKVSEDESKPKRTRIVYSENSYNSYNPELFKPDKSHYIARSTIEKWQSKVLNLSIEDMHIDCPSRLFLTFLTGDLMNLKLKVKTKNEKVNTNEQNHQDDFSDNHFEDEFPAVRCDDVLTDNTIENPLNLDTNTDNYDLDLPQHVEALNIDYAKVSVKINMKQVKAKMWDIIKSNETQTLNHNNSSPDTEVCIYK